MYGEAARMQDAVTALLDTYLEEYGTRLKAYNALIKDLDLKKGAKLAAEVKPLIQKTAQEKGILTKTIPRLSVSDYSKIGRALASVYTTDPAKGVTAKDLEILFGDIYEDILSEGVDGDRAWRLINKAQRLAEKAGGEFLVGHHGQGLKSLMPTWRYLRSIDENLPRQVMNIFKREGVDFGEHSLKFIATLAHTPGDLTALRKDWKSALNTIDLDKINPNLKELVLKTQAHQLNYGGLDQFKADPSELLKGITDPRQIAEKLKPFIAANTASWQQAETATNAIIKHGFNNGNIKDGINLKAWDPGGAVENALRDLPVIGVTNPKNVITQLDKPSIVKRSTIPSNLDVPGAQLGADGTKLYSGLPLGTMQDHIETAKDVVGRTPKGRLVRGAAVVGGALPILGVGVDAAVAGHAWNVARKNPSIKNIGAAVGESAILADQVTPFGAVGQMTNQVIRQYTDPERGPAKINTIGRSRYSPGVNKTKKDAEEAWKTMMKKKPIFPGISDD